MAVKSYTKNSGSKRQKNNAGRPTVITPEVVSILVGSFSSGMNIREACWQSGISHEAYYSRVRDDEQFADTMARAQAAPTMSARQVIVDAINNNDVGAAKWWLERKATDEFGRNPIPIPMEVKAPSPFPAMTDEELIKLGRELQYIHEHEVMSD